MRAFSALNKSARVRCFSTLSPRDVVIVSAVRTPIGTFCGGLSSITGPRLGSIVVKEAVQRAGIKPDQVQEVVLGNVVSANQGQAPARQAAMFAGIPESVPAWGVEKVCASGMKAVMLASQSIALGQNDIMVAGGFESMSNTPFYLDKARSGMKYGHGQVIDGLMKDGLWDVYGDFAMGNCGEKCAKEFNFTREAQDAFALESYRRALEANKLGYFKNEIVPVTVGGRKGDSTIISEDEEPKGLKADKVPALRPAFTKDGTITAANASKLNDGASALVLMSYAKAQELGLKPLAKVRGYADAARAPIDFTTAPALAVPKALSMAGLTAKDVDYHEINEAFAVVVLANSQLMNLDPSRVNIHGGAVALGHPIGCSGARIITTLVNVLKQKQAAVGCASICNGGGGASAIVIENLD